MLEFLSPDKKVQSIAELVKVVQYKENIEKTFCQDFPVKIDERTLKYWNLIGGPMLVIELVKY